VTVLALAKLGHQYFLYAAAGVICLVTFVILILRPALSAHGRIWEKAAAGFLAVFVLAALVIGGVVIGLVVVLYYPEISEFVHGK
jgi:nitrate reductase gamma subunit